MRLLLDTATFIWAAASPNRLTRRARSAMEAADSILEMSSVSITEIAIKNAAGKLPFSAADVKQAIHELDVKVLPYPSECAFLLFELPMHHRDLFDRQIITHALVEHIPVVTPDGWYRHYAGLTVIW